MRVKCLAQEHNTMSPARAQTQPLTPESSALTMRSLRLSIPTLSYASVNLFEEEEVETEERKQEYKIRELKKIIIITADCCYTNAIDLSIPPTHLPRGGD